MNIQPTPKTAPQPRWVREALYYADRPSRRPLGRDLDEMLHGLQLDVCGGRVIPAFDQ